MAFNKDADKNALIGQDYVMPGLEKSMKQRDVPKKDLGNSRGLREGMKQGKTPRTFTLKSPNDSMKQGKK